MTKWVYGFGGGSADGDASMKNLLGGKGANLAEMSALGLPVPPGFTVTTEVCTHYYANGETYPADLQAQVQAALEQVEGVVGKTFGDERYMKYLKPHRPRLDARGSRTPTEAVARPRSNNPHALLHPGLAFAGAAR